MAEYNAFTKCLGIIPGGHAASGRSDTAAKIHDVGTVVYGVDSAGYRGKWIYVKFGEVLTYKGPAVVVPGAGTTLTAALQFVAWKPQTIFTKAAGNYGVHGCCEGTPTANYYGWLRVSGPITSAPWSPGTPTGTAFYVGNPVGGGDTSTEAGKWTVQTGGNGQCPATLVSDPSSVATTANIILACPGN